MTDTTDTTNTAAPLTPEQATAKLAELTAAFHGTPDKPTTPAEAKARLDALSKDPKWRGDYLAGNGEARREFGSLTEMVARAESRIDEVMNGTGPAPMMEVTTPEHPFTTAELRSAVDGLREIGLGDDVIRQVLEDYEVSPEERRAVENLRRDRMADAEWTKKLLAGDHKAKRELTLMSIVLSSKVRGA